VEDLQNLVHEEHNIDITSIIPKVQEIGGVDSVTDDAGGGECDVKAEANATLRVYI